MSHDRRFVDNVVTSIIASEGEGRWREYEGDVEDWLTQVKRSRMLATPKAAPLEISSKIEAERNTGVREQLQKKKLSYKEQRELEQLPAQIEALEAEQQALREALADGTLYARDHERAAQLARRDGEIEDLLMQSLERWEALST